MANQHYDRKLEFRVSLGFKVNLTKISNYHYLSEEQLLAVEKDFKEEIYEFIRAKVSGQYDEEVTLSADFCEFTIE